MSTAAHGLQGLADWHKLPAQIKMARPHSDLPHQEIQDGHLSFNQAVTTKDFSPNTACPQTALNNARALIPQKKVACVGHAASGPHCFKNVPE